MLWFVDGGILNGTPNNVGDADKLWFMSTADSSFILCGLSIVITGLVHFGSLIVFKLKLVYKRWNNQKKNNLKNKVKDIQSTNDIKKIIIKAKKILKGKAIK